MILAGSVGIVGEGRGQMIMMADNEQLYVFVDKTGHCFEDFQKSSKTIPSDEIDKIVDDAIGNEDDGEKRYRDYVGAMLRASKRFTVGDMLCFRDDLTNAGFEWGKDFYVRKVG